MGIFSFIAITIVLIYTIKSYGKLKDVEHQIDSLDSQLRSHIRNTYTPPAVKIAPEPVETPPAPVAEVTEPQEVEPDVDTQQPEVIPPEVEPESPPVPEIFVASTYYEDTENADDAIAAFEKSTHSRKWEKLIGENLMGKLGILALVIGIGFFVKLAIDNNWINEVTRTILGILAGLGLWGIAYRLKDNYRSFSSVLAGGGFAVSFVTIAVAYNFYRLFSPAVTLAIFVVLCVLMTWIALRYDRRELAVMALLGGYLAPFLSAGPNGSVIMLLSYTTLLSAALSVITYKRNWWELSLSGTFITWIIIFSIDQTDTVNGVALSVFSTVLYTMFSLPVATVMRRTDNNQLFSMVLLLAMAVNQIAYLCFGVEGMNSSRSLDSVPGLIPLYIAALNGVLFLRYYREDGSGVMADILRWIAILGVGLFAPVQFTSEYTICSILSVYALLLTLIYVRSGRSLYFIASVIVMIIDWVCLSGICLFCYASAKLAVTTLIGGVCYMAIAYIATRFEGDSIHTNETFRGLVLNIGCGLFSLSGMYFGKILFPAIYTTVCFTTGMIAVLAVSMFWRPDRYTAGFMTVVGVLWVWFIINTNVNPHPGSIVILYFGVISLGVAIYLFACKMLRNSSAESLNYKLIFFSLIGSIFLIDFFEIMMYSLHLSHYYSATFSVGLIVAGAVIMTIGLQQRLLVMRMTSLGLYGVLLVKLLAYDLWRLPMVGRIVVFILLGVVLLSLSFMYQKLKSTLFARDE